MWTLGVIVLDSSSIMGAIDYIATVLRLRAPGMTMWRIPMPTWMVTLTGGNIRLTTPMLNARAL